MKYRKTGAIAKGFHEGTRSEYLAQYIFSALGTSVPVPHPEDSGIDLYCTLGEIIGKRFHVDNYYFVQVKSNKEMIVYEGDESIKWLLSHKYPLFICTIDKKSNLIETYQTVTLSTIYAKSDINSITLTPDIPSNAENAYDLFHPLQEDKKIILYLGNPILRFDLNEMAQNEFIVTLTSIMKSWIGIDQENINLKNSGFTLFRLPKSYKTNEVLEPVLSFTGNFKNSLVNEMQQINFQDNLFKYLSLLLFQAAADNNKTKFILVIDFIKGLKDLHQIKDTWGIRLVKFAINEGSKRLGLSETITLLPKK